MEKNVVTFRNLNTKLTIGNAEKLDPNFFENNKFDCVFSNLVLNHVCNPENMLKEAYRVLAPGGRAGFTVWGSKENSLLFTLIPKSFSKFKKCKKIFASSDVRSAWHLNDKKKV